MQFELKQSHIENGKARKCSKCPFALAIGEVLGKRVEVMGIGEWRAEVRRASNWKLIGLLDAKTTHKIREFDDFAVPLEPGIYELQLSNS